MDCHTLDQWSEIACVAMHVYACASLEPLSGLERAYLYGSICAALTLFGMEFL